MRSPRCSPHSAPFARQLFLTASGIPERRRGPARDASEKDPRRRREVIKGEAEEAYLFASAALETEPEADTGTEIRVAIAAIMAVGPIVAVGHYILRCREGVNGETLLLTEGRRATTHSPWPCD